MCIYVTDVLFLLDKVVPLKQDSKWTPASEARVVFFADQSRETVRGECCGQSDSLGSKFELEQKANHYSFLL